MINWKPALFDAKQKLTPFLTDLVAPIYQTKQQTGVLYYMPYGATTVQSGRGFGVAKTLENYNLSAVTYSLVEKVDPVIVDDRWITTFGSQEAAEIAAAGRVVNSCWNAIETATAVGILDASVTTLTGAANLSGNLWDAVSDLRDITSAPIALVCSRSVFKNIVANAGIKQLVEAPAQIVETVPQAGEFKSRKADILAGVFGFDAVYVGSDACWYDGVTAKEYCAVMALPNLALGANGAMSEVRAATTVGYQKPEANGNLIAVGSFDYELANSIVVEAVANIQFQLLNPDLITLIQSA